MSLIHWMSGATKRGAVKAACIRMVSSMRNGTSSVGAIVLSVGGKGRSFSGRVRHHVEAASLSGCIAVHAGRLKA